MTFSLHHKVWPAHLPKRLDYPQVPLTEPLETSARRYPEKPALIYYGRQISYRELWQSVERVAGALRSHGVEKGDRVALYMGNCPQFVIAFYGILRANAVVVPVNPMLLPEELAVILADSGAKLLFAAQDLAPRLEPIRETLPMEQVVVTTYSDYAGDPGDIPMPDPVKAPPNIPPNTIGWDAFLEQAAPPPAQLVGPDDLAVLPYTSGSTGIPKGCMHTHATVTANVFGGIHWSALAPSAVGLAVLPLFHVTGMVHSMAIPLSAGGTVVLLTRWDRDAAARSIQRYKVSHWVNISTMVVDFLANPKLSEYDLSSLLFIGGGGAALPEAVGERLFQITGLRYCEGYGLSETISQTHFNPPHRPKLQCLGVPSPDTDAKVVDLATGEEVGVRQEGEILVSGPQVMTGYWQKPQETEEAFVRIDGRRYLKTGDIGYYDEEGYFFIVDRAKRMINAAGFKVWPAEIETLLYKHPAVAEACVVGSPDERKGEEVKAFVVLRPDSRGRVTAQEIIDWSAQHLAAYKHPRLIEFVDELPKSGTGKIQWRLLQERERAAAR